MVFSRVPKAAHRDPWAKEDATSLLSIHTTMNHLNGMLVLAIVEAQLDALNCTIVPGELEDNWIFKTLNKRLWEAPINSGN